MVGLNAAVRSLLGLRIEVEGDLHRHTFLGLADVNAGLAAAVIAVASLRWEPDVSDERPPHENPSRPRLTADRHEDRVRVGLGSLALLRGASVAFASAGNLGLPNRLIHTGERAWARTAARVLRLRLDIEGLHIAP